MAWLHYQLGHGAAAVSYGNCSISTYGNDPDASDKLGGAWNHPEPVRAGGRSCDGGVLLQHGRFRGGKLPGE